MNVIALFILYEYYTNIWNNYIARLNKSKNRISLFHKNPLTNFFERNFFTLY